MFCPSRYDSDVPMSSATLNRVMTMTYKLAQKEGQSLAKFGPHDLRRTASMNRPGLARYFHASK